MRMIAIYAASVVLCMLMVAMYNGHVSTGCGNVFYSTTAYPDHKSYQCFIKVSLKEPKPRKQDD